jgi:hypothetical protein
LLQHLRIRTVGIEFNQKSVPFYLTDQEGKTGLQRGFTAGDADPVNPIPKRVKTMQNILHGNGKILFRMQNEGVVMAVRTAEIAVGEKDH